MEQAKALEEEAKQQAAHATAQLIAQDLVRSLLNLKHTCDRHDELLGTPKNARREES